MAATEIKVSPEMEALISEGGIDATPIMEAATPYAPVYRIVGEAKIPVSKYLGTLWKTRKDNGITSRKETEEAWAEAYRYYDNDQMPHRHINQKDTAGNTGSTSILLNRVSLPSNVNATLSGTTSAVITFDTDLSATGVVLY